MIAGWSPGIGDPTFVGWLTVANYCLSAYACHRAVQADESNKRIWYAFAICLVLLAINKQLDLQLLVTSIGREAAKLGGWYENRRILQLGFIVALASAGGCGAIGILYLVRKGAGAVRLSLIGSVMLMMFFVMRAAFLQKLDILPVVSGGVTLTQIAENLVILVVSTGAWLATRCRCR